MLKKAHDALSSGGALIVYEHLIDDERRKNVNGLLMSLMMLVETQGGFDYTGADVANGCVKRVSTRRASNSLRASSRWWSDQANSSGAFDRNRLASLVVHRKLNAERNSD